MSSLAFILAFKMTYVANVAVIYATAPFMAAGLSWLIVREQPRPRTLAAALFSMIGVGVIVSGGLAFGHIAGDAVALTMAAGNALYMVLIHRFHRTDAVLAGGVSGLVLFAAAWLVADPLAVGRSDAALLAVFGFAWALALVLWTEGTRLITAAESGLFGTAETPFAMLLAWLALAELPPPASFVGGAMVIAAVAAHAAADMRRDAGSRPTGIEPSDLDIDSGAG